MKKFILPVVTAVVLASCGGGEKAADDKPAVSEQELVSGFENIRGQFKTVFENPKDHDQASLTPLNDSLSYYVDALIEGYPKAAQLPEILCKAGVSALNVKNGEKAIKYLSYVVDSFPQHQMVPKSMYFIGRTKEVVFEDVEGAKEAYKELYRAYPNTDWGYNAKESFQSINNPLLLETEAADSTSEE